MTDEATNIYEGLDAVYGQGEINSSADRHSIQLNASKD